MRFQPVSITFLVLIVALLAVPSPGFVQRQSSSTKTFQTTQETQIPTQLNVVPGVETIGIAVASAAVGAAARQPEIDLLQAELTKAQSSLEESKAELLQKIELLEDKLFEMDQAYEAETAKFKDEYENMKQDEIVKLKSKMKEDYKFKLDIELEKEKSRILSENFAEKQSADEQSSKLAQMRLRAKELENAKKTLELAVTKADQELQDLRQSNNAKKGGFWRF